MKRKLFSRIAMAVFVMAFLTVGAQVVLAEDLSCQELEGQTGWYARYFNYLISHPDMGLLSADQPDADHNDPLSGSWDTDWYDQTYYRFDRIDPSLNFGEDFFPFDTAKEEETNGHEYHFGVHWQAKVTVPSSGNYAYTLTSDDDAWVYVDGVLQVDNSGIHAPITATGTLVLSDAHIVEIFFAERQIVRSHFDFSIQGEIIIEPYRPDCELETGSITVCKVIIDGQGNIADGSENAGSFSVPGVEILSHPTIGTSTGVIPTSIFTTPLSFNANLIGSDQTNDAECIVYDGLEIGNYFYGEEQITGSNWLEPLYNDQHILPVSDLTDFLPYSGELFTPTTTDDQSRDTNVDGHITLSTQRPNRTLVILNQYELPVYAPYCGDNLVNQDWEQCDGTEGCTEQCQPEEEIECFT